MIDPVNLEFKHYYDNRQNNNDFQTGFSGQLELATDIRDGKKYIIKHTYSHNAANEFVSCWLAEKMGIPAPHAYLISPCEKLNSKYAVAIEYIEGLAAFDKNSVPEELQADLIGQFVLNLLISNADRLQMGATTKHIYSYDFSEAFGIEDESLLQIIQINEDIGIEQIKRALLAFRRHLSYVDFDIPGLAREFNLDPVQQKNEMIAIAKRVLTISKEDIDMMFDELSELYDVPYAVYYEECIYAIQERIKMI